MGFIYNEAKREAKVKPRLTPKGHIPIASLNKLGCSVCPRDTDRSLRSPKMEPSGDDQPLIYLLGTAPNEEEDDRNEHWVGKAGRAITSKFTSKFYDRNVRAGHITQCMPKIGVGHPEVKEIECCRPRVVADIEQTKPLIVVGVGDDPLHWATGLPRNAITFRGGLIATKIGRHACWYYPILYPNYVNQKQRSSKNEFELTLEHDIAYIEWLAEEGHLEAPVVFEAPYDGGIELITGQEEGDMQRLEEALHWLIGIGAHGLDYETNAIKPHAIKEPKIWTAAAGTFERVIAFAVDHPEGWGTETRMRKVRHMLGDYLLESGRKRCHNLAFEQEWSAALYGEELLRLTEWEDTMAMGHTFDERQGIKSLDVQCRINFGFFLKDQSRVDPSRNGWIKEFPLREVLRYNGLDSKWTDKLADYGIARLRGDDRARQIYENKVRLAPTLVLTTAQGMPIDFEYAEDMVVTIDAKLAKLEDRVRKTPEVRAFTTKHGTFSLTNPEHALKLYKSMGRKEIKRTKYQAGKEIEYETADEEALMSMPASEVPSAPLIVDHRQLTRNESTYLLPLLNGERTGADGKMHAEYHSMTAVSGRLSSDVHNWPKRKYKEVRGVVAPSDGFWVLACDYGQIQFRGAGMLSEDPNLIKYCWTGYDVHAFWAQRMVDSYPEIKDLIVEEFDIDWDEKGLKTLRQEAKNKWVFPQLFGASTDSCATNLHLPGWVADDLGAEFWDEFRYVKKWQDKVIRDYEKNLYVETPGGIRRRGPISKNELINHPIQGIEAEIVLAAMNAISERSMTEGRPEIHPVFMGHDDLSYIVSDAGLESAIDIIVQEMCKPRFDFVNVPLIVEVSVGPRWHELEKLRDYSSADLFNLRNPYR